jgi:hypothetical protein
MATYQEVQDRINNEYLNRGTFIQETKTAIKAAIRFYERQRWDFNETSVALATSAGQSYITFPDNYLILDHLQITVDGIDEKLERRDKAWILSRNAARDEGIPTDFATFQNRINLSPIPDDTYAVPIHYIKHLDELSAATDTNAWLEGAFEDLICYHAAKIVWGVAIRNDKEAAKFASMESMVYSRLTEHHEQTTASKITPTSF